MEKSKWGKPSILWLQQIMRHVSIVFLDFVIYFLYFDNEVFQSDQSFRHVFAMLPCFIINLSEFQVDQCILSKTYKGLLKVSHVLWTMVQVSRSGSFCFMIRVSRSGSSGQLGSSDCWPWISFVTNFQFCIGFRSFVTIGSFHIDK